MQDDAGDDLIALYRSAARDIPDDALDRVLLGKARAVAWRRRHGSTVLAVASCGTLALMVCVLSVGVSTQPPPAIDTARYGMTDGRVQLYATGIKLSDGQNSIRPGMNVHPIIAAAYHPSGEQ